MRHCRENCDILSLVSKGQDCPILLFKKTRKQSDWYFVKDGKKLIPKCEEKNSRTGRKGLLTI